MSVGAGKRRASETWSEASTGARIGCAGVVIWQQIVRFGLAALLLRESAAFVLAFGGEGDLGDVPFMSAVGAADSPPLCSA